MNPIQRRFDKHGSYPTATLRLPTPDGQRQRKLEVYVTRGYICLQESNQRIYIPRTQLWRLLKWLVPLAKLMDEDFDPRAAMIEYSDREDEYLTEQRKLKKQRRPGYRRRR